MATAAAAAAAVDLTVSAIAAVTDTVVANGGEERRVSRGWAEYELTTLAMASSGHHSCQRPHCCGGVQCKWLRHGSSPGEIKAIIRNRLSPSLSLSLPDHGQSASPSTWEAT
ncbi:hypothetical protein PoB_001586700 [Plakobranchus ocellatus]|uniref:Uncharacterized protein n=1 Tax=Plakobranchus ocellatus TaxID=259542 RepID=A0AAV3Z4C8_9GAST|nr:hypothetical protein PoB_001586700 [Plakobranchus ocellatus]